MLKVVFVFLKIKDNVRKYVILEEYFVVNNFLRSADILKILQNTFDLEKVVFKDTCRYPYI
jgi:hypothetical protein